MKILVIEDEKAIRSLLTQAFQQRGHEVLTAEDGQRGLDAIMLHNPDVVFVDLIMPELTGLDVLTRARGRGFTNPVIMLTGSASMLDLETARATGAYAVVLKPFRLEKLEALLKEIETGAPPPTSSSTR